jgi:hypothetical protein
MESNFMAQSYIQAPRFKRASGNSEADISIVGNLTVSGTFSPTAGVTFTGSTLSSPVINTATVKDLTEIVTATNVITAAETGSVFFLNSATEFVSTLPAPAAGLKFTFIVQAPPSGASYTVVGASGTPIHGMVLSKDLNGATDSGSTAGTGVLTLTFVDGKSQKGDRADFVSNGTDWFVVAYTGGPFDAITLS